MSRLSYTLYTLHSRLDEKFHSIKSKTKHILKSQNYRGMWHPHSHECCNETTLCGPAITSEHDTVTEKDGFDGEWYDLECVSIGKTISGIGVPSIPRSCNMRHFVYVVWQAKCCQDIRGLAHSYSLCAHLSGFSIYRKWKSMTIISEAEYQLILAYGIQ